MRDIDIRRDLNQIVIEPHRQEPDTRVIEELALCQGECRIDLAVINGELNGWEIKSDRDTLVRLPRQVEVYNEVFDRVTLVSGQYLATAAKRLVPKWWGFVIATGDSDNPLRSVRAANLNPRVKPERLVQLLWREELMQALDRVGRLDGLLRAPKRALWTALAASLSLHDLKKEVRSCLKARTNWRVAEV
jgi:hypothetical protein